MWDETGSAMLRGYRSRSRSTGRSWRGSAIMASAKGHEFFLRNYLGTHDNTVAEENAKDKVKKG
jgi:nitrate reductase alpha subunit